MVFILSLDEQYEYIYDSGVERPKVSMGFQDDKIQVVVIKYPKPLRCQSLSTKSIEYPYFTKTIIDLPEFKASYGNHDLNDLLKLFNELMSLRPESTTKSQLEDRSDVREVKKLIPGALNLIDNCRVLILQATPELTEDAISLAKDIISSINSGVVLEVKGNDLLSPEVVQKAADDGKVVIVTTLSFNELFPKGLRIENM